MSLAIRERQKYEAAWAIPEYARFSPAEHALPVFRQLVRKRGTLLDIGCGTGRAAGKLSESGYDVSLMDFVYAAEVDLPFIKQNLFTRWKTDKIWDYGYCCDVMEHIPPSKVKRVLENITKHCRRTFFSIHFLEDNFGKVVGHPLHLTIKPFTWWRDLLRKHGTLHDARDCLGIGYFYLESDACSRH